MASNFQITAIKDLDDATPRMPFRPNLAVVTAMNRFENRNALLGSLYQLRPWFRVYWFVKEGKDKSIGTTWQELCELAAQSCFDISCANILDDDNLIHPDMAKSVYESFVMNIPTQEERTRGVRAVRLLQQVNADGSPRGVVQSRQLHVGSIDAAQFVFDPKLVETVPFPDTNNCPDGVWAEALAMSTIPTINLDGMCYYNGIR
jgi:hypothetical protein